MLCKINSADPMYNLNQDKASFQQDSSKESISMIVYFQYKSLNICLNRHSDSKIWRNTSSKGIFLYRYSFTVDDFWYKKTQSEFVVYNRSNSLSFHFVRMMGSSQCFIHSVSEYIRLHFGANFFLVRTPHKPNYVWPSMNTFCLPNINAT